MNIRVVLALVFALLVGGVAFLVMSRGQTDRPPTLAMSQEPDGLNLILSNMLASQDVIRLLHVPLFDRIDEDGKWTRLPAMAVRIPTRENGLIEVHEGVANDPPPQREDGESDEDFAQRQKEHEEMIRRVDPDGDGTHTEITVRWELQPDAVWSDGQPVTAEDYIWTWEFILSDYNPPVPSKDPHVRIRSMESEDDGHTLVVRWKEPYAFHADFNHPALPKHIHQAIAEKTGGGEKYKNDPISRNPIGNGPYVLHEWQPKERIIFRANPNWWGPEEPTFKELVYMLVPEVRTIENHLLGDAADATAQVGVAFDDGLRFEARRDEGSERHQPFVVHFTPGLVWEHIDVNLEHPILRDVRVRKALLYGMDRQRLSDQLFEGRQPVAHSWVPPAHPGFNPDAPRYPFDRDKAIALLEEAGWKLPDGATVRVKNGEPLRLTLSTTSGNQVRANVAELIQQDFEKIGIDLKINTVDPNTFFDSAGPLTRGTFELGMYAWIFSATSDGVLWTSSDIPTEENGWQGSNNPRLRVPEIDEIDGRIPVTLDPAERKRLFQREQEIWLEHLPALPLYYRTDVTIRRATLQNWRPTIGGAYVSWNADKWFFTGADANAEAGGPEAR